MDEAGARGLLERMSAVEAPPSRVDIGLARQRGGQRLRRRRWGLAAAPVLAAAAVVAVVLGTSALSGMGRPGHGNTRPVLSRPVHPPHRFNPLAPYAAFGWLPKGVPLAAGSPSSLPTQLALHTGSPGVGSFSLTVWAPGTCNLDAAQVLTDLRRHQGHPRLNCMQNPSAGSVAYVARQAPPVRSRPAFWLVGQTLAWEYAPNAWATLQAARGSKPVFLPAATVLKVAAHVRYAATSAPSVKFAYQLTGVPASWRVTSVYWRATSGGLLGRNLDAGLIGQMLVTPGHNGCWPASAGSQRITLNGVKAVFTVYRQRGSPSYQGLCVPETDGLSIDFLLFRAPGRHAFPLGGVTGIFLHHLHLLGPDPANWTTHPLG